MKRRSQLTGFVRRCSIEVNGERCEGAVTQAQAARTLRQFDAVLCGGHEHARHAPKIAEQDAANYAAFKARADAIRAAEAESVASYNGPGPFRIINNRLKS